MSTSGQYLRMELKAIMESLLYFCIDLLSRETILNQHHLMDRAKSKKDKMRLMGHRWGVLPAKQDDHLDIRQVK